MIIPWKGQSEVVPNSHFLINIGTAQGVPKGSGYEQVVENPFLERFSTYRNCRDGSSAPLHHFSKLLSTFLDLQGRGCYRTNIGKEENRNESML